MTGYAFTTRVIRGDGYNAILYPRRELRRLPAASMAKALGVDRAMNLVGAENRLAIACLQRRRDTYQHDELNEQCARSHLTRTRSATAGESAHRKDARGWNHEK